MTIQYLGPTCQESPDAKSRIEASFFCNVHVLKTPLDVQRVRKHYGLLICNTLAVIEITHHLDEL